MDTVRGAPPGTRTEKLLPIFEGPKGLFDKLYEDGGRRVQRESAGPAGDSEMGQVVKGIRWMPWHQEAMKDAGACDTPRRAGKRALTRGCPNGETHSESCRCTLRGANAGN